MSDPRASRRIRPSFLALALLVLVASASCGRLPLSPVMTAGRAAGLAPGGTRVSATTGNEDVIAQLASGVSPDSITADYGTTVDGSIPQLDILLLRTPASTTTDDFLRRLQADPRVRFAELDAAIETAESRQSVVGFSEGGHAWGDVTDQGALTRIEAPLAHQTSTGAGELVAILDTGIDLDHPALMGVLALPGIEPGVTTSPGDDRPQDVDTNGDGIVDEALGHGTHVAGIVHAVAPDARLLAVRVLDSDGVGDAFGVARGLVLATDRGATVANLSLGMTGVSLAVSAAIDYARAAGVVVVAAAGNAASTSLDFPASDAVVVAVAGTDSTDQKASFSDYGPGVDLAAPGVGILSTYWDGGYARWSGTSMAAPFVSGVAALVYSRVGPPSTTSAHAVEDRLTAGATSLAAVDPVYGTQLGAGRVDASASVSPWVSPSTSTSGSPGGVLHGGH